MHENGDHFEIIYSQLQQFCNANLQTCIIIIVNKPKLLKRLIRSNQRYRLCFIQTKDSCLPQLHTFFSMQLTIPRPFFLGNTARFAAVHFLRVVSKKLIPVATTQVAYKFESFHLSVLLGMPTRVIVLLMLIVVGVH